jgi:DNA-binding transcriptional LysR family regulator
LQLLLTQFEPPEVPVHAVWPAGARAPAKTRLFVEQLAHQLGRELL